MNVAWVLLLGDWWLCVFHVCCIIMYVIRRSSRGGWARRRICWPRPGTRTICWRQAIHPLHTHIYLCFYLHCFTSSYIICATILVASFGLDEKSYHHTKNPTSPQILPMYPPRTMTSSHALESSHRTYLNKIWSYPIWIESWILGRHLCPKYGWWESW